MKSILVVSAEPDSLADQVAVFEAANYKLLPAYSDGDAFEMLLDASVALDAIVFCGSVPKQTRSTLKQLLSLEGLEFPVANHIGPNDKLLETLSSEGL